MIRVVAVRRCVVFLLLLAVLATPALAGNGPAVVGAGPAGLVSRLVDWLAALWGVAAPPAASPDGGCTLDPSGGCHGAVAPPSGCGDPGGTGCGESS